jgi:hypothetical protein
MSIAESTVDRVYECLCCKAEISVKQLATEGFHKECPLCEKDELVIKSARSSVNIQIEPNSPKTMGMIAQKNTREMEKEQKVPPGTTQKTPWWRKEKKINYDILKNPTKFIETGKV